MVKVDDQIQITQRPPIEEKHGVIVGKIYDVRKIKRVHGKALAFVAGDTGELVGLFDYEYKITISREEQA